MKKYSKYKDSGVEWIGVIPDSWKTMKLKQISRIYGRIGYRGYTVDDIVEKDHGVITISPSNIKNDTFTLENLTYLSFDKYYESPEIMIFPGDIVLVKTGSTIGKTALIPEKMPEMTINPQLVVLKNVSINSKFLYYQTVCNYFKESFEVEQTGSTTPTISQEKINSFPVLIPSEMEQIEIVNYLDSKTSQIDDLIKKKEELVRLLELKRQTVINETVTKGLNPKAKMKDSGVEWSGEVPEGWEVKKLKYIVSKIGSGVTPTGGGEFYLSEGVPLLRSQNIYNDRLRLDDVAFISEETHNEMAGSKVKGGDVLLNITGASIGRCYYYDDKLPEANVNQHVCIIRPYQEIIATEYLHALLCSSIGQTQIDSCQTGSNRVGLNNFQLANFKFPIPRLNEQKTILDYLSSTISKIDQSVLIIDNQLEKLKEYKKSLIYEVVTGKIDVSKENNTMSNKKLIISKMK